MNETLTDAPIPYEEGSESSSTEPIGSMPDTAVLAYKNPNNETPSTEWCAFLYAVGNIEIAYNCAERMTRQIELNLAAITEKRAQCSEQIAGAGARLEQYHTEISGVSSRMQGQGKKSHFKRLGTASQRSRQINQEKLEELVLKTTSEIQKLNEEDNKLIQEQISIRNARETADLWKIVLSFASAKADFHSDPMDPNTLYECWPENSERHNEILVLYDHYGGTEQLNQKLHAILQTIPPHDTDAIHNFAYKHGFLDIKEIVQEQVGNIIQFGEQNDANTVVEGNLCFSGIPSINIRMMENKQIEEELLSAYEAELRRALALYLNIPSVGTVFNDAKHRKDLRRIVCAMNQTINLKGLSLPELSAENIRTLEPREALALFMLVQEFIDPFISIEIARYLESDLATENSHLRVHARAKRSLPVTTTTVGEETEGVITPVCAIPHIPLSDITSQGKGLFHTIYCVHEIDENENPRPSPNLHFLGDDKTLSLEDIKKRIQTIFPADPALETFFRNLPPDSLPEIMGILDRAVPQNETQGATIKSLVQAIFSLSGKKSPAPEEEKQEEINTLIKLFEGHCLSVVSLCRMLFESWLEQTAKSKNFFPSQAESRILTNIIEKSISQGLLETIQTQEDEVKNALNLLFEKNEIESAAEQIMQTVQEKGLFFISRLTEIIPLLSTEQGGRSIGTHIRVPHYNEFRTLASTYLAFQAFIGYLDIVALETNAKAHNTEAAITAIWKEQLENPAAQKAVQALRKYGFDYFSAPDSAEDAIISVNRNDPGWKRFIDDMISGEFAKKYIGAIAENTNIPQPNNA
ncbi:MAG: hypothetical protein UW24_C0008G0002 [Parcubacteria group bacterium GW2011_GWA2_44_12]|nr:MAG: hypothetical protein UW24_C0008G0002 [Parcubacteria group bacterium GW2011_GWA2_44_12]